ncbi:MarR family transcriptional regulator [Iamia majanohamensis]|uniref:MarR family transcriptional regulator n=1 Tax=Iamia majanohamensis TaxID=467976 RepID=A0AAE9Y7L1_9ACTN|nr:MarR family transcriptional regulator [Iamia majanohamensis]WCO68450.1 MarR family transcriptional regulator [Iamia majanohamensis]
MAPPRDPVDDLVDQWARERPDLTFADMATIGRLARVSAQVGAAVESVLAEHGLTVADFDVLATLRRAGAPFTLRTGAITRQLMLSPAGMTGRVDRLEGRGLVARAPDPDDRRGWRVRLTDEGRAVVDAAVADHVANEGRILAGLSPAQRRALDGALRTLTADLG